MQKVVLLSLDRNRESSLLASNHTSLSSRQARRLNPAGKMDLVRVMGWRMNRVSVSWGTWGEAKGHLPGISQRTASLGSVQIRVEDPNGAAVCTACPRVPMLLSLIFAGGSHACVETAMGETRRWMNFVTWQSVFYTSAAFQRSQGRRNPPIIGQERRYCAANHRSEAVKMYR